MSRHFKIVTLGCPKNSVDSEQAWGLLCKAGFIPVEDLSLAEIIILNTCGFIESAREESINTMLELMRYKEYGTCEYLVMAGCLVQKYADELKKAIPEVNLFLGTGDLPKLPRMLCALGEKSVVQVSRPENYLHDDTLPRSDVLPRHYAYVKIAEGCNNSCSYCVIPQLKGAYRSRTVEAICHEVKELVKNDVKEIILIAQDTTFYGIDLAGKYLLPELLRELVKIPGLCWVRLLYCYPDHLTDELLQTIKNEEKICKYLDIPLQHISDSLLQAMGRRMNKEKIIQLLKKITDLIPDITIRSTFIVGFPGETTADFQELLVFLKELQFERAGFFAYSQEPDTPAASFPGQISEKEKLRRVEAATTLQEEIMAMKQAQMVGRFVEIIVDGESLDYEGLWEGRTKGDAPEIDGVVYFKAEQRYKAGDIIKVKVTHSEKFALIGESYDESGQ